MDKRWYGVSLVVVLAGCGGSGIGSGSDVSCSIAAGADALRTQLQEGAVNQLRNERKPDGSPLFSGGSIEAAVESIVVSLTNHRTTRDADKSKRVDCQAQLTFSIPSDRLNQTMQGLERLIPGALDGLADRAGYRHEANALSSEVRYALQPTDDGKAIYAELEQGGHHAQVLQELAKGWLIKPLLDPNGQVVSSAAEAVTSGAQAQNAAAGLAVEKATEAPERPVAPPAGQIAARPSFNCAKASTVVEQQICQTPVLSELDRELASTFSAIRKASNKPTQSVLLTSQRDWMRARNTCGADVDCLKESYLHRIDQVCAVDLPIDDHPGCIDTDAYRN